MGKPPPLDRIEGLASGYIGHIKEVFPKGGYSLGGHSFGGIVAFEMARQMEALGDRVEVLVIFDTPSPDHLGNTPREGFDEISYMVDIIGIHEDWHGCSLDIDRETLEKLPDADTRLELVVRRLRETGMGMWADMTPGQLKKILNIYQSNAKAQSYYGSQHRISSPILLLRAKEVSTGESSAEELQSQDWGWGRFTRSDLFIESVPGNHVNMMNAPHVKALAQKLMNYLKP